MCKQERRAPTIDLVTKFCTTCTTRAKTGKFSASQAGSEKSISNSGDANANEDEDEEVAGIDAVSGTFHTGDKRTY